MVGLRYQRHVELSRRVPLASSFSPKAISAHVLVGSALGVVHLLLLGSLGFTGAGWQARTTALAIWTSLFSINRFGMEVLLYGFVLGITGIVQFQIRAQQEALKSLELQKQLSTAHLRALQMQLESHFLFNTLNAITTLVELERSKEAAEMLSHLNAILKSYLEENDSRESSPVAGTGNHGELPGHRTGQVCRPAAHRDHGRPQRAGWAGAVLSPPAHCGKCIRHGIANCENEGLIEASARRDGSMLHLRVRDSGPGLSAHQQNGHGIGLRDIRERLTQFYQGEYMMKAQPVDTGGFEVAIAIPYECSVR
jgi:sensor histidine kinase YesM